MMKKVLLFLVLIAAAAVSLAACSPVKYNEELLKNRDFSGYSDGTSADNGTFDSWLVDMDRANTSDITVNRTTSAGQGNVVRMYSQSSKEDYNYIYQEVAVKKNAYYKLSVKIYTKNASDATTKITGTGAFIGVLEDDALVMNPVFGTSGKWLTQTVYFYNKSYSTLKIALRVGTAALPSNVGTGNGGNYDIDLQFDDASLTMIEKSEAQKVYSNLSNVHRLTKNAKDYSTDFGVFLTVFLCVAAVALSYTLYHFIRRGLKAKDLGEPLTFSKLRPTHLLVIVLGAAFVVRILVQTFINGYDETTSTGYYSTLFGLLNDGFLAGWSDVLQSPTGRSQTPGMLLIYGILGGIKQLFNIEYGAAGIDLLAKIPGIIADLLAAGYIFLYARKTTGEKTAFMFALIYAVLPSVFLTSAGWGSADSLMGLFLILTFFALLDKRYSAVCIYTTLAVVFSHKALYVLPLVAVFLGYIFYRDTDKRAKLGITAAACILGFWLISFPFTNFSENPFYVFVQYTVLTKVTESGTLLPVINYTTLDAFNFYAMINGNFAGYTNLQGGFDIVIALSVFAGTVALYFKRKNRADLLLLSAFAITALFMFTLGMQPYSMVFALAVLLIYVLVANEKRAFFVFSAFSLTTALNILLVLNADGLIGESTVFKNYSTTVAASLLDPVWTIILSVINVLLTVYFAYVVYDITYKGNLKSILPKGDDSGDSFVLSKVKGLFKGKKA